MICFPTSRPRRRNGARARRFTPISSSHGWNCAIGTRRSNHGFLARIVTEAGFANVEDRPLLLRQLPQSKILRKDVELLWRGYDVAVAQELEMDRRLTREAQRHEPVRRFQELPGYARIRSATFYVYVDTPWRFSSKSALWKYVGIGLDRRRADAGAGGAVCQQAAEEYGSRRRNTSDLAGKQCVCRFVPKMDPGGNFESQCPSQCGS